MSVIKPSIISGKSGYDYLSLTDVDRHYFTYTMIMCDRVEKLQIPDICIR